MKDFNDSKLVFYDYKTKQLVPVCNKPDCKHDNSEVCAAYIAAISGGWPSGFIPYGDYIYYFITESFEEISIVRTNLDNSGRITLAKDAVGSVDEIIAVNNKIYYNAVADIYSEDGEDIIGSIKSIRCLDLETNKVSVVLNPEGDKNRRIAYEGANDEYIYFYEALMGEGTETRVDDFDGTEFEVPELLEANLKKLSLKTLEETVIADMRDATFDYHNTNAAYFVRKKGEGEFEVLELDYQTGELKELFTTDMKIAYMVSDKDRLMYDMPYDYKNHHRDCMVFDKRTKTSKEVHFKEEGYLYFAPYAEHADYFIGDMAYEDRQVSAMIKKDDFFNGNLQYDLIQSNIY